MSWQEAGPERCAGCGQPYLPGEVLLGWEPDLPHSWRTYHCIPCRHTARIRADQIQLREVRRDR